MILAGSMFATAQEGALVYAPLLNGRFEAGVTGWSVGPGTTITDADYNGDQEAVILGSSGDPRLVTDFAQAPVPAYQLLTFIVERGGLSGVTMKMTMAEAVALLSPPTPDLPDIGPLPFLRWEFGSLEPGRYFADPAMAEASGIPGWETMTPTQRYGLLATYVYLDLEFGASQANHRFGSTVDAFAFVV